MQSSVLTKQVNANVKTQSTLSLLHIDPNLQTDLFLLLLNFQIFSADVQQTYMQVCLPPHNYKYDKALYRFSESEQIRSFQFTRVPFGLKSSPYRAMRTV